MKIVIVGPAHPYRGGIAMFNEVLAQNLIKDSHSLEIVNFSLQYPSFLFPGSSQYTQSETPKGIAISRMVNSVNPLSWIKSCRYIARQKPDLVIFRYWMPFMAPSLGWIARGLKRKGIKTVAITDNIVPHEKHFYDRTLTRYFLSGLDRVVYMSMEVGEDLARFKFKGEGRFAPHPIYDVYGETVDREVACERIGIDPNDQYVMFFGFIRDYKGLDLLLEAWAIADKQGRKLLIAGEFYGGREKYIQMIKTLGIEQNIILHDHYIAEEQVKDYFSVADMVVQPYRTATQSGITQIAYHFGVPMIVTNVGGLSEIVPDSRVGYVIEREPEQIAHAIERFYSENRACEFKKNIQKDRDRFSWSRFIKEIL
ncbi:MAG: glycosyltransferase [Rikenellaceae bacterium]